jgi:hypothetical protein
VRRICTFFDVPLEALEFGATTDDAPGESAYRMVTASAK